MPTATPVSTPTRIGAVAKWLVALAVSLCGSGPPLGLEAQERPSGGDAVETIQVRPSVYVVFGGGANVTVQTGPDGVILVDSGSAAMADRVLAAVKAISAEPIRMVINTSADADHVGGNQKLASGGTNINPTALNPRVAAVLAHENVLLSMSAPTGQQAPFGVEAWPTETYTGRQKSMYLNDEGIQVIRQPAGHSDGDSIVFFRRADVIVTGDIVDLRHFPVIDRSKGGSIKGEIDALNRLLDLAIPAMPLIYKEARTLVVPGHGRISDHAELVEYRDMVTVIRDLIQAMVDKGMTLEQVKAANPTQGYRARYGDDSGLWTAEMFVEAVYRDLTETSKQP